MAEEKKVKKAKDVQAKANLAVKKQEGIVKTAEKALDDKVSHSLLYTFSAKEVLTRPGTETWTSHPRDPDRTRQSQDRIYGQAHR